MARRGFGGMTALRAALGAAVGVGEGLQQRELVAAQKQKEEAALERQRQMDLLSMLERTGYGFEDASTSRPPAAGAGAAPSVIGQVMDRVAPGATQPPSRPMGEMTTPIGAAVTAADQQMPTRQKLSYGGREFNLISPEEMASRKAKGQVDLYRQQRKVDVETDTAKRTAEREFEDQQAEGLATIYQTAYAGKDGKPLPRDKALVAAKNKKDPIDMGFLPKPMSESERQNVAARWSELQLSRDRFNFEKTKPATEGPQGSVDYTAELQTIQDFLPTVGPDGKVVPPKRTLSGPKSLAVQQGGQGGTFIGQAANLGLSSLGADMSNEQLYNSIAEGIATSYAMQEQKGKNVSDKDIANRISQIKVLPNEVGSLEVQRLKGQRLLQWANSLKQGNVPQVAPGKTATPPSIAPPRAAMTPDQWMDANPQKAGETDAQYEARYRASARGGQ